MKLKKLLMATLAVALSVTALTGCGSKESANGEVTVNIQQEPSKLNSILATGSIDGNVLRHVMVGLVSLDEKDQPEPGVAKELPTQENGGISEDKKTVTFKLREDGVWSNGEKVTAHDFVYALDQLFTAENAAEYAGTWAPLIVGAEDILNAKGDEVQKAIDSENKGYKALSDYELEFKLTGPYDYFVSLMAYQSFYPVNEKAVEAAGGVSKYATEADNIVTNGPFKMTSWLHEDNIVLERNEDYWDKDNIKLSKITMRMIADSNTVMNEFKAGNLDLANFTGDQVKKLEEEGTEVLNYADGSNFYIEYNTQQPGLNNKKIRQALTLAVNAQGFVDSILKNKSTLATSFTPDAIWEGEFKKEVGDLIERPDDNYATAKKLLEEGLKEEGMTINDLKLELIADEGDSVKNMVSYIQSQFKENIGLDITVTQLTYKARLKKMTDKDFSIIMAGWGPDYNDPMTFMDLWVTNGGNNHTNWSNAEYDALIEKARNEVDAEKRTQYFIDAEKLLMDEMPIGPIYCRIRDYAVSDRLKGSLRTAFQDMDLTGAYVEE